MKLFLDTTKRDEKKLSIKDEKGSSLKEYKTSEDIFSLLKKKVKNPKKIAAVGFKQGSGSFTGLRTAASIANALRFGLGLERDYKKILAPQYGKELKLKTQSKSRE